jgi:hypothetical protein
VETGLSVLKFGVVLRMDLMMPTLKAELLHFLG